MRKIIFTLPLILAACSDKPPSQAFEMPPAPVLTGKVEVRDVPLYFEAIGTVRAFQSAEVKPQVAGMITGVHFVEGQAVKKGDLLYTIEENSYSNRVHEMQALLAQNQSHLNNAHKKLERFKSLTKENLIAKVEWDALESQIALYEAMVQVDEARLDNAKLDLEHCRITAPIDGHVGKSALEVGNMASNTTLVTISQLMPLYVDFSATEREFEKINQKNPPFEIFALGSEESLGNGEVTFIDHTVNTHSGMVSIRGKLEMYKKSLLPGQMVRAHLMFGKKEEARLIPIKAIKTNQSGPYIFSVKEDGTVEMHSVKLGPEEKGMIVVEEGLENAQKVVVEGQGRLFPGCKIEEK